MYCSVDKKTFKVTQLDEKQNQPPHKQYGRGAVRPEILASLSGRSKKNTTNPNRTMQSHLYDLEAGPDVRSLFHLIINISSEAEDKLLKITTSLETKVSPKFLERVTGKNGPIVFFGTLIALEEFYASQPHINHVPWIRSACKDKFKGNIVDNWARIEKLWPELFQ